jgi:hypothetical protein
MLSPVAHLLLLLLQIIVCWADSPAKMEYEHPSLTAEMTKAWGAVFASALMQGTSRGGAASF